MNTTTAPTEILALHPAQRAVHLVLTIWDHEPLLGDDQVVREQLGDAEGHFQNGESWEGLRALTGVTSRSMLLARLLTHDLSPESLSLEQWAWVARQFWTHVEATCRLDSDCAWQSFLGQGDPLPEEGSGLRNKRSAGRRTP